MVENSNLNRSEKRKPFKKMKILIIILIVILILIIGASIYFICSYKSATGQLESFKKSIEHNEYNKVAKQLSNNDVEITKTDAMHLIIYLKEPENQDRFNNEIEKIKNNINRNDSIDKGRITDANGHTIIEIRQNGKAFLLFDKLKFDPKLLDVYIEGSNTDATYQYGNGEKKDFNTLSEANKTNKIGRFMVGKYKVDAKKIFKNEFVEGSTNGQITIDTDNRDKDGKIIAKDDFNQTWFEVELNNANSLDRNSLNLYINNKKVSYKRGKTFGKYPTNKQIEVYGEGKLLDKVFKTNKKSVIDKDSRRPQLIKIAFDKNEIEQYKKEVRKKESKTKIFMSKYTDDLNEAYKHHNFKYVSKYFKSNTEAAKHIKNMTESKQKLKYSKPKYLKIDVQQSIVKVELSKKNNKDNTIKSSYELKYNDKKDTFKILDYQDI